jgi:hypothetical protein
MGEARLASMVGGTGTNVMRDGYGQRRCRTYVRSAFDTEDPTLPIAARSHTLLSTLPPALAIV